ncbi:conserved hypothetical protein [Paraglaciecola sp. T6c]|uniref:DUF2177 family protein n=1 Tax=Pseudoalteromonas atlantica (strain T6c / ATCC BAA-1087) TaxID=3042615 RepID=UPI00005C58B4|nr:DUF2177 family protein [Paraglaciecola sp. T6c]ABG42584.1 conserved hypothetical protein [Paraglaciecola sp. T6c]
MKQAVKAYIGSLLGFLLLDAIWLGLVAKNSYIQAMQGLMREDVHVWPWVVFYSLYCMAIVYLVVLPRKDTAHGRHVLAAGAVLGAAAYGAYNMTNYALLAGWPLGISLQDWAWGTVVTSLSSYCGWRLARR